MSAPDEGRRPLLHDLVLVVAPIVVAEACVAVREWLRREHKARLRQHSARPN